MSSSGKDVMRLTQIKGKGRALVATQPLRAGQTVLRDSPILLYSAFPLMTTVQGIDDDHHRYCSNCFRILQSTSTTLVSCPRCSSASNFCSPKCLSTALATSHTPWVCQALCRLRDSPSSLLRHHVDRQLQARFLVAAYNLASVSPSDFQTLLSLQGNDDCCHVDDDDASLFLHTLISSLSPHPSFFSGVEGFSPQLTAALLAKDKLNTFGLMEPFEEERERSVRAYGIYPRASFFNHDCLPNACRFDYLDGAADADPPSVAAAKEHSTDLIIRMIHDVPEGREICLSYFPVNLKYSDRQRRLREDYGFTCECDRCKVEESWSEEEAMDDDDDEDDCDQDMEEMELESERGDGDEVVKAENDFPHAYFFLRYMCNRNNCWGTLAPLSPTDDAALSSSSSSSVVVECNVCGNYEELMSPEE